MNTKELLDILEQLGPYFTKMGLSDGQTAQLEKRRQKLAKQYETLTVEPQFKEVYDSLITSGNVILGEDPATIPCKKVIYFLNYLQASFGDFSGKMEEIRSYYQLFLITTLLGAVLTHLFSGKMLLAFFWLPMLFIAIRGLASRSKFGYAVSLCLNAFAFLLSLSSIAFGALHLAGVMPATIHLLTLDAPFLIATMVGAAVEGFFSGKGLFLALRIRPYFV